jgi:hypothetical protein
MLCFFLRLANSAKSGTQTASSFTFYYQWAQEFIEKLHMMPKKFAIRYFCNYIKFHKP